LRLRIRVVQLATVHLVPRGVLAADAELGKHYFAPPAPQRACLRGSARPDTAVIQSRGSGPWALVGAALSGAPERMTS
jgi:hypothetical protein